MTLVFLYHLYKQALNKNITWQEMISKTVTKIASKDKNSARQARQKPIPLRLPNDAVLDMSTSDWNDAAFQSEGGNFPREISFYFWPPGAHCQTLIKNFADLDKIMFFLARVLTVEPSAEYLNIIEEGKLHMR